MIAAYRIADVDHRVSGAGPSYEAARDAARAQVPEGAVLLSYRCVD